MAMKASTGWGESPESANAAKKGTLVYSNTCLQHTNLNGDEWLEIENWVRCNKKDDSKITVFFSGPFYDGTGGNTCTIFTCHWY